MRIERADPLAGWLAGPRPGPGRRRGDIASRRAREGHGGRGDHRVPARQRAARAPVPRPDPAQGHREPHRPGRLAPRGIRRDRHGPPARAHGLQGHAHPPRHPGRHEGARGPVQRLDLARSHELLRDPARRRREPRVRHPARGRPDGQQPDQGRGPGDRVLGRPQRVRVGRELAAARPLAADDGRRLRVAQLRQVHDRQPDGHRARARRQPPGLLQATYYQPDNAVLVVAGKFDEKKALWATSRSTSARSPSPTASSARPTPRSPRRTASGSSPCGGSAASAWSACSITSPPARTPSSPRSRSSPRSSAPSRRAGSTRRWWRRGRPRASRPPPRRSTIRARWTSSPRSNTKDQAGLEKVRDTIFSVAGRGRRIPASRQEEVDRARQSILKDRELSLHDPNSIAIELSEWAAQGDWRLFFLHRDRIEKVTPAEVKEVAAKYLTASNRTVGFFLPTTRPERTPIPETPDVAKLVDGYKGRQTSESAVGRGLRRRTGSDRGARAAARADRRRQARAAPQEEPRRVRSMMRLTLRYGNAENLKGLIEAGQMLPELMTAGHEVDDPPADRGRARQELRPARRGPGAG